MKCFLNAGAGLVFLTFLAGCEQPLSGSGVPLIAIPQDRGLFDRHNTLNDGVGGIAYDPDGCQVWVIDDGVEGYSGRRVDPVTGLPICDQQYPAGSVIGHYKTNNIPELLPGQQVN